MCVTLLVSVQGTSENWVPNCEEDRWASSQEHRVESKTSKRKQVTQGRSFVFAFPGPVNQNHGGGTGKAPSRPLY